MVWEELYQEKLICNQPLDQFIPKELLSDFPALLSLCLKSEHLTFERILSFPNGKSLHLKLTFNPICVGDRVSYILISIQNNYRNRALLRQKQRALFEGTEKATPFGSTLMKRSSRNYLT